MFARNRMRMKSEDTTSTALRQLSVTATPNTRASMRRFMRNNRKESKSSRVAFMYPSLRTMMPCTRYCA